MYNFNNTKINNGSKIWIESNHKKIPYKQFLLLCKDNKKFRNAFAKYLLDNNNTAIRFETPPVTTKTINQDFECVVLSDNYLTDKANSNAFRNYFNGESVVSFYNLGKDALLIVPSPIGDNNYSHLMNFLKNAPKKQISDLWQAIGINMLNTINGRPIWLNTAGAGVPWLHFRLDSYPKYYRYSCYIQPL